MRFFTLTSALALVAAVVAQQVTGPNAFNLPTDGTQVFQAGQSSKLTWSNKQGNTVTIKLRTGDRSDLQDVSTIASNIANTGEYTWNVDSNLPEGANYALEIIDDDDTSQVNYSGQFVIQSNVKAVATSGSTGVVTATSASAATSAATGSATTTGSSASSATAATNGTSSGMSTSASKTASASKSASASSSSSPSSASVPANAASKPAVGAAGALLMVAAGFAFAL